eukprot:SAG22_NODE_21985_length_252_cov_0.986928_1_plen_51_part_00
MIVQGGQDLQLGTVDNGKLEKREESFAKPEVAAVLQKTKRDATCTAKKGL